MTTTGRGVAEGAGDFVVVGAGWLVLLVARGAGRRLEAAVVADTVAALVLGDALARGVADAVCRADGLAVGVGVTDVTLGSAMTCPEPPLPHPIASARSAVSTRPGTRRSSIRHTPPVACT
jgi:hypothetical protein